MIRGAPCWVVFAFSLVAIGCSETNVESAVDEETEASVAMSVLASVQPRAGSQRTVERVDNADLPTAETVHGWAHTGASNVTLFLTITPGETDEEWRQTLYVRIFDDHREPADYAVYPLAEEVDEWQVFERSADRLVIATHQWIDGEAGNLRTFIITFPGAGGHGHHGFYPAPDAIEVAEAQTPLSLVNPSSGR